MASLEARIRERLDAISAENDGDCATQCGRSCADDGYGDVMNAVLAVLEMHRCCAEDWTHVSETAYEAGRRWALDQAVDEIAEALGIKASDG